MYLSLEKALYCTYKKRTPVRGTRHDGHAKELIISIDTSAASGLSGMSGHTGLNWLRIGTGGWRFGFH
jgi:hypothetical protein